MKIVTWNCNGKFREKRNRLFLLDADLYVVQECENPKRYPTFLSAVDGRYLWSGSSDHKGIAVFWKNGIRVKDNGWKTYGLRHFLSVNVNQRFDLVAVWAGFPYIEEYYIYQQIYLDRYTDQTVVIGDFNSSAIWNKEHGERNHSAVVDQMKRVGLVSAYHHVAGETHGEETTATFFLQRNFEKPYHIDYCFCSPERIRAVEILDRAQWLKLSDHLPLTVDLLSDVDS